MNCPLLPGFEKTDFFIKRAAKKGMVQVIRNAWADPNSYKTISSFLKSVDSPSVASAVNKYASVISMPHFLLSSAAKDFDLTHWPSLYRLAELFDVTISALTVRLRQLRMIFISGDKKIYSSKEEYYGQRSLFE